MEHNLAKYLARHPECEVYCGQDQGKAPADTDVAQKRRVESATAKPKAPIQKRVTLWHKVQKRKVVGNAAPLEKNVHAYLAKHPEYEIYDAHGQEKEKDIQRSVEKVLAAIVTSVVGLNRDLDERIRPVAAPRKPKRKIQKQVSGGKRPKLGDRSTSAEATKATKAIKAAKAPTATKSTKSTKSTKATKATKATALRKATKATRAAKVVKATKRRPQEPEPLNAGLSFLVQIATDSVDVCHQDTSHTATEKDLAGGLLELLAQATASAAVESKPTYDSPPFSPMAQPTLNEGAKMEELSLAPSSVPTSSFASFHRLS